MIGDSAEIIWEDRYNFLAALHKAGIIALLGVILTVIANLVKIPALKAIILLVCSCIVAGYVVIGFYKHRSLKYWLLPKVLYHKKGIFVQRIDEVEIIRVDDFSLKRNLLDLLTGVGTVVANCPTDPTHQTVFFEGIREPVETFHKFSETLKKARKELGVVKVDRV